jgi:hypothetical protein
MKRKQIKTLSMADCWDRGYVSGWVSQFFYSFTQCADVVLRVSFRLRGRNELGRPKKFTFCPPAPFAHLPRPKSQTAMSSLQKQNFKREQQLHRFRETDLPVCCLDF